MAAGQESLRADGRRREVTVVESRLAAEIIVVVMVFQPDGLARCQVLARAFSLFGQAVQLVIQMFLFDAVPASVVLGIENALYIIYMNTKSHIKLY